MAVKHLTHQLVAAHQQVLCDWARANGLDPEGITVDSIVHMEDGKLTVEQYVRDAHGNQLLDPDEPNRTQRTTRTVPLLAPWPLP